MVSGMGHQPLANGGPQSGTAQAGHWSVDRTPLILKLWPSNAWQQGRGQGGHTVGEGGDVASGRNLIPGERPRKAVLRRAFPNKESKAREGAV